MRACSFFVVSALAAALAFGQFLSTLERRPDIQFVEFKKHSCKTSAAAAGHHCRFAYSTDLPANQIAILPPRATISGMFLADGDGQLRFEMAFG